MLSGVVQLQVDIESGWAVEETRQAKADALARMARALVLERRGQVRGSDRQLRAARWGDLALLLPRFTILEPYEAALRRHEVPYRTEAGRAYYRRDETHALGQILRALADPGDTVAVVAALRGPGFGCSDHDLTAYALCVPRPRFDLWNRWWPIHGEGGTELFRRLSDWNDSAGVINPDRVRRPDGRAQHTPGPAGSS